MFASDCFVVKSILHARPVASLLRVAKDCNCEMFVKGKSDWESAGIINLLMMGAKEGTTIELAAKGENTKACLARWRELFEKDFPVQLDKAGSSEESD